MVLYLGLKDFWVSHIQKHDFVTHTKKKDSRLFESRHEKTCFSHMRTTKVQISLRIHAVWSAPLLFAA